MGHSAIMSVRITGNSSDAVKAFEKASRKAAAFGSFVGNVAAKGVEKLWDKLTGFTSDVVNMSDSVDKFKNTMRFAGIDSSAIDKAAKDARKYADETVYGLDDIQNTMAQLAANGVKNYVEVTQAAGNLNAVAGGNADTFKSVTMALTQTIGAGKLTTENWNQIADAIPGASGKLQEAMRKNNAFTGDFREAMAKGQITADEFSKALVDLGMTDVAKQAATSTQTIEGALGNLEAAVTGGLTDAFNLFKPAVTGALSGAASAVESFSKRATGNLEQFAKVFVESGTLETGKVMLEDIRDAGSALVGAFGDLIDAINPFSGEIKSATDAGLLAAEVFNLFTEYVGYGARRVKDAAAWIKDMARGLRASGAAKSAIDVFNKLKDVFGAVAGAIKSIITALPGVGDGAGVGRTLGGAFNGAATLIGKALDVLEGIADWASRHSGAIISAVTGVAAAFGAFKAAQEAKKAFDLFNKGQAALATFKKAQEASTIAQAAFNAVMNANPIMLIVTAIGAVVAALAYWFTQTETGREMWSKFMGWLGVAWENLLVALRPILDAIGQAWAALCEYVGAVWDAAIQIVTGLWNSLRPILQPILDWMKVGWKILGDYVQLVWRTVGDYIKTVVDIIKNVFKLATSLIRGDWQGVADAVRGIWDAVGRFFGNLVNNIVGFFANACGHIVGFFANAGQSVRDAWNGVLDWFAGLPGRILGFFEGAGSWLWNAGSAIIGGLWEGLKSSWAGVADWFSGLGGWIQQHKGPPEYDKIMLVKNGQLIMQGFAKGLTSGFTSDVRRAINGVNGQLRSMPLNVAAAYEYGVAGKDTRPDVTVNITGTMLDEEGVAREITRILNRYVERRA